MLTCRPIIFLVLIVFFASACATMQRTDVFFGLSIPGGGNVSEENWKNFIDTAVSPRFPEGYTEMGALGKWRDSDTKETISEHTKVLVFIGKKSKVRELHLDTIIRSFMQRYQQQAVLRLDSRTKVRFVTGK